MKKFLVDANLPYYFNIWHSDEYIHQFDINPKSKDEEIWQYSKSKNLTIITKDSDFSNKIIFSEPPPKVIHIRIGNMKIKELNIFLSKIWGEVLELNKNYKLVNVFLDRLEGIN